MKLLHKEEWLRQVDKAKMKIEIYKVAGGIKQKMFVYDDEVMDTFSKRPYKLGQSCDGTIDDCVHALFIDFCRKLDLDPVELYEKAYPNEAKEGRYNLETRKMIITQACKQGVEYPIFWGKKEFEGLCESLSEINNHSLVGVLLELDLY